MLSLAAGRAASVVCQNIVYAFARFLQLICNSSAKLLSADAFVYSMKHVHSVLFDSAPGGFMKIASVRIKLTFKVLMLQFCDCKRGDFVNWFKQNKIASNEKSIEDFNIRVLF